MLFQEFLQSANIPVSYYLSVAKRRAKASGYNPKLLQFSNDTKHKLSYNGVKFGANGYNDYIIYNILYNKEIANVKRQNYRKRAFDVMQKTGSDNSPASLSYYILW